MKINCSKKVCITIPCLCIGGTEIQTLNLIQTLLSANYEVSVICYFEWEAVIVQTLECLNTKVYLLNWKRDIRATKFIKKLGAIIHALLPDVVHVQYMTPGALPIIAARLVGVKRIFATVHQPWTKEFHGIKAKILMRVSAMLITRFITVSENTEKSWFSNSALYDPANHNITRRKHFTIYNSIDLIRIDRIIKQTNIAETKAKLGWENVFVIGAVSRLRPEKGIDLLLEAFSRLVPTNADLRLMLVGSGTDEASLKSFAVEKGIIAKVIFAGNKNWEEAIALIKIMDIVVCPSRFEGFGLTAAEAMALSKPVIASSVFGLKEVVITGETGFTFTMEDTNELTQCLISLIKDIPLQQKFGQSGRQRAQSLFSLELFEKKIEALYLK